MGTSAGTCSSNHNYCEESTYCPPNQDAPHPCKPCDITQPFGSECNCGGKLLVGCAECDGIICKTCANLYFLEGNICNRCEKCPTCTNNDVCLSCLSGQYLENGICKECSETMPQAARCYCQDTALEGCILCAGGQCGKCRDGYVISEGKCHSSCEKDLQCGPGAFCQQLENGKKKCEKCKSSCATCSESAEKCTSCMNTFYLKTDSTCQNCKPDQQMNAKCNCYGRLIENCVSCEKQECVVCAKGQELKDGSCGGKDIQCQLGFSLKNGDCVLDEVNDIPAESAKSNQAAIISSSIVAVIVVAAIIVVVVFILKKRGKILQNSNSKQEVKEVQDANIIENNKQQDT